MCVIRNTHFTCKRTIWRVRICVCDIFYRPTCLSQLGENTCKNKFFKFTRKKSYGCISSIPPSEKRDQMESIFWCFSWI